MTNYLTSKDNYQVKHAASLQNAKYRNQYKEFLLEGKKALELALKSNLVLRVFTTKELSDISEEIEQYVVTDAIMDKIAFSTNPEGVVAICKYFDYKFDKGMKKIIYLDHVNDPGNIGTIIRTALALNYDGVALSKDCCSIYNEKVIAATKGALFLLPTFAYDLKDLKDSYQIIVSTLNEKSINPEEVKLKDKYVLVLGNEAHGVSEEVTSLADELVKIPVSNIDSLNVSIAAGILMYLFK